MPNVLIIYEISTFLGMQFLDDPPVLVNLSSYIIHASSSYLFFLAGLFFSFLSTCSSRCWDSYLGLFPPFPLLSCLPPFSSTFPFFSSFSLYSSFFSE